MSTVQGAGIYYDSGTNPWNACEFHFQQLYPDITFDSHSSYTQESVNSFIINQHTIKLAAYHVSFPAIDSWVERFDQVYPTVKHSFVLCSELHESTLAQLKQVDRPNVTIYINGKINFETNYAKVDTWMDWFYTTTYFYKNKRPDLLDQKLDYFGNKSKHFDILLGCQRAHRDFIHNYITINQLQSNVIMTYHKRWHQDLRLSDQYITEDEGVEYISTANHIIQRVQYYDHTMSMSQIVPIKIYNQTCFSLVAETNAVNHFNFFTEKIVKPILAKRLFIVIAGQNYLRNLKSFGFKTFDCLIDESYDQEHDNETRWAKALDQLKYLCNQNPLEVFPQIEDIVQHNQNLMLNRDWYKDFRQVLLKDIARIIAG
jgi:hypothetical protein